MSKRKSSETHSRTPGTGCKKPKITAKQEGGDDGYCYVIRVNGAVFVTGLTRSEVPYYKKLALKRWEEDYGAEERSVDG